MRAGPSDDRISATWPSGTVVGPSLRVGNDEGQRGQIGRARARLGCEPHGDVARLAGRDRPSRRRRRPRTPAAAPARRRRRARRAHRRARGRCVTSSSGFCPRVERPTSTAPGTCTRPWSAPASASVFSIVAVGPADLDLDLLLVVEAARLDRRGHAADLGEASRAACAQSLPDACARSAFGIERDVDRGPRRPRPTRRRSSRRCSATPGMRPRERATFLDLPRRVLEVRSRRRLDRDLRTPSCPRPGRTRRRAGPSPAWRARRRTSRRRAAPSRTDAAAPS